MAKRKEVGVEVISLSRIDPDPNQPRKNFDPDRLKTLMDSIQRHGIMNPLIVEKRPHDRFLLVDGERRYRAAKELELKEVPAAIIDAQGEVERRIQQFHIQEQHEGWTSTEKATAIATLAVDLKMSAVDMAKLLGLPHRTVETYAAFATLLERKTFEKEETPLVYASRIQGQKKRIRRAFEQRDKEFTQDDESNFELGVIRRIKSGDIKNPTDVVKIGDAAVIDPDSVKKFLKSDKMSVQKLFIESEAKVARHFRNIVYAAHQISSHIQAGLPLKVNHLFEENASAVSALRNAQEKIDQLLGKV